MLDLPPQPVEATALTMLGAMREATLYVALAQHRDQARQRQAVIAANKELQVSDWYLSKKKL